MKDKIAKLINVKSIVTLALTAVFAYLSASGKLTAEQFQTVFTTVIAFYFGTQYQKNSAEINEEGN
jgi:hypothetical protein